MTIDIEQLRRDLVGTRLPGDEITLERHESAICDMALCSTVDTETAHPMWFIIASLRCMGITVDELCAMARMSAQDTLLFGECTVRQESPLSVGGTYRADASITEVKSRTMRDGARLDSVQVEVTLAGPDGTSTGAVTSRYLFRRGGRA